MWLRLWSKRMWGVDGKREGIVGCMVSARVWMR